MPILYSVISRGTTVLARHAICAGNFSEVTEQILEKISIDEDARLTYSHASYLFHYIVENGLVCLCITDNDFERQRAFLFLEDIKTRFYSKYHDTIHSALSFEMNSQFSLILSSQMKHFSESSDPEMISNLQGQVCDVKDILIKNIDSMESRGERLELLVNKTSNLNISASTFKTTSQNLARKIWWRNIRMIAYIMLGLGISIYIIGAMACGVTWKSCRGS